MTNSRDKLLLRAGIAAARRWGVDTNTKIAEIPPCKRWAVPIWPYSVAIDDPSVHIDREEIEPSKFAGPDGSIWLGYGPRSNVLVFWIGQTLEQAADA